MNEFDNVKTPELVLPGMDAPAAAPTTTQEAVFNTAPAPLFTQTVAEIEIPEEEVLSPEEQKAVAEFAQKIDLTNSSMVLMYGAEAQKNLSTFSETALNKVKTKDMGEVGGMLTSLTTELQGFNFDEQQPKGLKKLFNKGGNVLANMKNRYDSVEKNVDKISRALESHKIQLMKDIAMLDQMYAKNLEYYKQLTMYIAAGKQRLNEVQTVDLVALQEKARQSGRTEDAQAANDLANMCQRFEKKLYDLELTRTISIQMAPQIRLIQNNDQMMAEKIQTSLINTIPLWKNQMVLALSMYHSQQAMEAQRTVTNTTNELLKKNADTLKTGSIETAREAERGIVDIETLQYTNQSLISTLDEVLAIQQQGQQKRQEAEVELRRIEGELKAKLLELRG